MTPQTAFRRLRGALRSTRFERQMEEELRLHLELETEAHVRRGLSPEAARAAARRSFGSVAQVKDACRDSWGVRAIDALWQDLRYAVRGLRQYPSYTLVVLFTLALGIGATTAIFSVVDAVLLRSLPYAHGDRLVEIRQRQPGAGLDQMGVSAKEMDDYRRQTPSLDALVEYHQMAFNLLGRGDASRVQTGVVSYNFFDVIGVTPILGRSFRAEDDAKDAPAVLILSYAYWQRALGGDPAVVGRTFEMNDKVHTVVGVLPAVPQYPEDNDVYMPVSACPFRAAAMMAEDRTMRMVSAIGRLRPGVSVDRARRDLAVVAGRMVAAYPDAYPAAAGFSTTAVPVKDQLTRRARPTLLLLLAITGFVLLLVCANVANLTLARLVGRERELAVRTALGAGRARIVRQLFTESTLLAMAGGALGLCFAWLARDLLVAFTARFTPRAAEIGIDGTVLIFALAVSLVTGVLFGIVPALPQRRNVAGGLKDGPRTVSARGLGARNLLIIAQVAISFVLLIAAGLMVRSFINLQRVDAGFNADHVLTMRISLDFVKYDTAAKRQRYYGPFLREVASQPGVRAAALSVAFPLDESTPSWFATTFVVEGQPIANGQPLPRADFRLASPDYFKTIGMTLLRGRTFTDADATGRPVAGIVNLSLARHRFADADPIGHRLTPNDGKDWVTIVGVVNDVKQYGLATTPADELYLPFAQDGPLSATLLVRTSGDPMASLGSIQAAGRHVDPKQPISHVETLEDVRVGALASPRVTATLVSLFAFVALLITAAGIAAVVSFSVNQRTAEIGVRMALGAPTSTVVGMIVRQGLTPVAFGLGLGVGCAFVMTRLVAALLFAVAPTDPPTFAIVLTVLAAVAAMACLAPARRAAAIDPMHALRAD
jgi:putative ABC transport system permease protein